jgi:hypothetical protein
MGEGDLEQYFQQLNRLGYIGGKNLIVERYSVLGRQERSEEIARRADNFIAPCGERWEKSAIAAALHSR